MAKHTAALLLLALSLAAMLSVSEAMQADLVLANGHWRRLLTIDCPSSCNGRCSLAGNAKRCMQFCMICCKQCQCVPPGTFGNKQVCPCYANLKNSKGADKCP